MPYTPTDGEVFRCAACEKTGLPFDLMCKNANKKPYLCKVCKREKSRNDYNKRGEFKPKDGELFSCVRCEGTDIPFDLMGKQGNNKPHACKECRCEYMKNRCENDPEFDILSRLRSRLRSAVSHKSSRTMELCGCTLQELMIHLENQFTDGMTWGNRSEWHVDHIKPCSKFNLLDPDEQAKCFHYTNLQPLWMVDNLKKSNKYTE